jgi:hypothetical protein
MTASKDAMINRVMASFGIGNNPYPKVYTVDRKPLVDSEQQSATKTHVSR